MIFLNGAFYLKLINLLNPIGHLSTYNWEMVVGEILIPS